MSFVFFNFFVNDTATTEIYTYLHTLSLPVALPIWTAVEGAVDGDDSIAFGLADMVVVLAHHLDAALDRLGARIAEEHRIGETVGDQPLARLLLAGDPVRSEERRVGKECVSPCRSRR